MPDKKKISDKQQAFVYNYCTNGHNATKAYRDAGYSPNGAHTHANRLVTKGHIKEAIRVFMNEKKEEAGWTVERSQELLLKTYKQATELKQPSAAVSAITAVNRLYGMDKDAGNKGDGLNINITEAGVYPRKVQTSA